MAKGKKGRKKGRKSGRLSKAEIKKAGGIKQAWAARKHGRSKTKSPRKARRTAKQKAAAKRNIKKAQRASHKGHHKAPSRRKSRKSRKGRKSSRRGGSSRSSTRVIKSTVVRHLPGHTSAIVVSPIGSSGRKRGKRRGSKRSKARRGKSRKGQFKKGGGRRARETYAMENPLSGFELALGLFTGALGFGVSDLTDRFLATHALAASATTAGANGDTPPTAGDYKGLYNATAVLAPMNLPRWGAGLGIAAVPLVAAAFVKSPAGRSALQMFGFGAAMRTLGKGLTDLVAKFGASQTMVQQLYDGESRANALQIENQGGTASTPSASLPTSGLGRATSCTGCGKTGAGSCCSSCASKRLPANPGNTATQVPPPATQVAPPAMTAPPPPPPPPAVTLPHATQLSPGVTLPNGTPFSPTSALQGVPKNGQARKSSFNWGYQGDDSGGE